MMGNALDLAVSVNIRQLPIQSMEYTDKYFSVSLPSLRTTQYQLLHTRSRHPLSVLPSKQHLLLPALHLLLCHNSHSCSSP